MVKLLGHGVRGRARLHAWPAPLEPRTPHKLMDDLLEELSDRQDEPLAAVLAELRAECEEGDEDEACRVTALRPFLLEPLPEPAE